MKSRGLNRDDTSAAGVAANKEFGALYAECARDYHRAAEPLLMAKRNEVLPFANPAIDRLARKLTELGYVTR